MTSPVVYSREGVLLRAYLSPDEKWRHPIEVAELPVLLKEALLCLEDKRFHWHPGVDPAALVRAAHQNIMNQSVVSGASTITMQVARLLEKRSRTLSSKIVEALRAFQMEVRLTKEEILGLYLTYAPFGRNVEGLETAAQAFFRKSASRLTIAEAAFLYLLPQSPHRFDRLTRDDLLAARRQALTRIKDCGLLSQTEFERADASLVPASLTTPPVLASHWADYVRTLTSGSKITTTIAIDDQRAIEKVIANARKQLKQKSIHNIGILVIDNASAEVTAAIGNFDFASGDAGQAYNSLLQLRSPGSTLKPFLYAHLIQTGAMLPETLLLDIPSKFENYDPKNFSGLYSGLVTADHALSESLNVPFVRKLKDVGVDEFVAILEAGGITNHTKLEDLGLSAIIGAMEVTPLELAGLYASLGRGGNARRLRYILGSPESDPYTWLNPASVYLTAKTLAKRDRPDFPISRAFVRQSQEVHWKTGTSQGRKDAWSIGFDAKRTVAVWLGNLDQSPSPALVGADAAAPIMFDIFARLAGGKKEPASIQPPFGSLTEVRVCSFSGMPPSSACQATSRVLAVHGHTPGEACPFHDTFLVEKATGLRVTKDCDASLATESRSFLTLPSHILFWMRKSLAGLSTAPQFHPACATLPVERGKMIISSPKDQGTYYVTSLNTEGVSIPLDIEASSNAAEMACFLDGTRLNGLDSDFRRYIKVGPGKHHLFCTDVVGKSDRVAFSVYRAL